MSEMFNLQTKLKLSPVQAKILKLLTETTPVTIRMIEKDHELAANAKVSISKLRQQLDGSGIEVMSQRSVGYWLEKETADKVRAIMAIEE